MEQKAHSTGSYTAKILRSHRPVLNCFEAYFLNIEAIHRISRMTTTTDIMPTAAPALKIPAIAEQLLKHNISKIRKGKYSFFMTVSL
jgi:hypothetical protein